MTIFRCTCNKSAAESPLKVEAKIRDLIVSGK
jgi:hypothetical protein